MANDVEYLKDLGRKIRVKVLNMLHVAQTSHAGSCLSVADLLSVLYGEILNVYPNYPDNPERDRFILSKGHAAAALYSVLSEVGFFSDELLDSFCRNGSKIAGHASHTSVPGIEFSTGSLGHGLAVGAGISLVAKRDHLKHRTFVLLSDGECDEGSIWEAAIFAAHHRLDNLVAIIDYNKIQSLGYVDEIASLEPFSKKWNSFGWATKEIDGHSIEEILNTFSSIPFEIDRPTCVIAHTIKGKGVSFMEDDLLWHYRSPDDQELKSALLELGEL